MNIEIKTVDVKSDDYKKELQLRDEILRKPLGLSIYNDRDSADDIHIVAYLNGKIAGCVILTRVGIHIARMRQLAIKEEFQSKGIGKQLVSYFEELAKKEGYKKIILHARISAVEFYKKLNYVSMGNQFVEKTIPHVGMEKRI